jgi:hypothetical protein
MTHFQEQKISHLFDFFDFNNTKSLILEDFSDLTLRSCELLNYEPGSQPHQRIAFATTSLFHKFLALCTAGQQSISWEEWKAFFEKELNKDFESSKIESFSNHIIDFIFDLFDENGDGYISDQEYRDLFQIFGIDQCDFEKSFEDLEIFKDGRLSRNELQHGIETFLTSENPEEKGNWIFGNWKTKLHLPNESV